MQLHVTLAISCTLVEFLFLVIVGYHLCARSRLGIGDAVDKDIHQVVAAHLGRHGEVADNDVLLLLNIVIIVVAIGVAPFAVVAVFLIVVGLAVPIAGFPLIVVVNCSGPHLIGSEGVVGRTKVEAQLIHSTWLHLDVIGEHDGESLPLVGIRIVDGQTHFLLQTTRLAYAVGLVEFVVLEEREDVVVEDACDSQRHAIEADSIEIDGGLIHIGDDDAFIGPAHLGQHLVEVQRILIVLLEYHTVVGADAAGHAKLQLIQLVPVEVALVEIEVNLISFDVSLIAQVVVFGDKAREVLRLLQRLAEEQGGVVGALVDIEVQGDEDVFSIHGQVAFHLGLGIDCLAIENDMHIIIFILTLKVLNLKIIDIVSHVGHLNGMALAEAFIEQIDGLILVDGHGKGNAQVVVHSFVRQADRLLGHEAEVLAAYAEAELKGLLGAAVHEVGDLELADVVLVLVDVVVLEADGILIDPEGLAFQGRRKLEGLGGNGLAKLHLHRFGALEAHHDGLAGSDHTRGVAVQQRQQGFVDGLDALDERGILSARPLLAAGGQEAEQQHSGHQTDAADFFHSLFCTHIV